MTRGRPKNFENMNQEERQVYLQREREARNMREQEAFYNLSEEQQKAILLAKEVLADFVQDWTECFDIYNPETPRKMQQAFWAFHNHFNIEEAE
jgi:hypothetical protein